MRLAESWMLLISDTRIGFLSPSLNVVIYCFSLSCLKMRKMCLKRTLDATFLDFFGVDVLWRHRWFTSGMDLSHPSGWDNISPDLKLGGYSCLKNEKTMWYTFTHILMLELYSYQITGFPWGFVHIIILVCIWLPGFSWGFVWTSVRGEAGRQYSQ